MARSISTPKIILKITGTYRNTLTDGKVVSVAQPSMDYNPTMTTGIGDNQMNRVWQTENVTLTNNTQIIYDLYDMSGIDIGAGAGLDALGQAIEPLEEIVAIAVVNENVITAAGQLEIKPSNSEGWTPIGTHTVANEGALGGQGVLFKSQPAEAGFFVDSTSSHRLTLAAKLGDVSYSIYVFGRHDVDESSSSISSSLSSSSSSSSSASSLSSSSSSVSSSSESSSSPSSSSTSSSSSYSLSTSSSSESSASSSSYSHSTSSSSTSSSSSYSLSTSSSSESSESSSSYSHSTSSSSDSSSSSYSLSTSSSSPSSSQSTSSQSESSSSYSLSTSSSSVSSSSESSSSASSLSSSSPSSTSSTSSASSVSSSSSSQSESSSSVSS